MEQALAGQLEESEVKRVALSYRKLKDDEKAVELIDRVTKSSPALATSPILRDIAARARIDLAEEVHGHRTESSGTPRS